MVIVSYLNKWRFRSTKNGVRNLEFFFHEGEATCSELLRQLMNILHCLSLIDVVVTGVSCDAAGGNRIIVKYLLGGDSHLNNSCLEKVSFTNFFLNGSHLIFLWYCSTHNIKSGQNQLHNSNGSEKATRNFHDFSLVNY